MKNVLTNGSKLTKILLKQKRKWKKIHCQKICIMSMKLTIKMREYHVDSHLRFRGMSPSMSIRCKPNAKQLIILGQDESCFKQYSFSNKRQSLVQSWIENKLRSFKTNKQKKGTTWVGKICVKQGSHWNYGTNLKKPLQDELTLAQFFMLVSTRRATGIITRWPSKLRIFLMS